jgi:hypothetical protein
LQRRCLSRIVRPNENYGLAKFDLDVFEPLEVLDSQANEHSDDLTAPQLRDVQAPASVRQEQSNVATSSSALQPNGGSNA